MKIQERMVIFVESDNPDFGLPVHEVAIVINDEWTLEIYEEEQEWCFRKITGRTERLGTPIVELGQCQRFSIDIDVIGDVHELLNMTLWEIVQKYAK